MELPQTKVIADLSIQIVATPLNLLLLIKYSLEPMRKMATNCSKVMEL
jgi:hypothetical protein